MISEAYQYSGDYKRALEYHQQYIAIKDSVFSESNKIKLEVLDAQRELDLKDRDIEIERLKRLNKEREDVIFVIGIGLLIAVIGFLVWYYSKERRRAKQNLESNEHKFRTLIEHNADAVAIIGPDRVPSYISPTVKDILGYTDVEAMSFDIVTEAHPEDVWIVQEAVSKIMAAPGVPYKSPAVRMRHKDGHWVWTDATLTNMLHDPVINGIIDNFRDVTAQKVAEEKIIQLNRLYAFISQINQAIVRVSDEQALFDKVCQIAVEYGKFGLAMIGTIDDLNRKVNMKASNKADIADLNAFETLPYAENGLIENMLKSGSCAIFNDYSLLQTASAWKEYTEGRGYRSAIVLPLKKAGKIKYAFVLLSKIPNFFDDEERALLEEAAYDVSFALEVFEKERQRKEMVDKMAHNELQLKQAQSISHVGSWELDFSTGVAEWSEEACRIFGLELTDNKQSIQSWQSFIHPEDKEFALRSVNEAQETLSNSAFYHRIIRGDGTIRHIYSQAEFIFDNQGQPIGLHGAAHDVTEMKEAEIALAQSEANLRLIMDLIPQSVYVKDCDGRYLVINKSSAGLYGRTPDQLTNTLFQDSIPVKEEADEFFRQCREVLETGETMVIPESTLTDHEGNVRLFHTVKLPFTVAGTNEKAVLAVATDITEQKHAEAERLKIIADIVQRNTNLEQFSYIVSHNLRAPVANIIALADLLQMKQIDADQQKSLLSGLSVTVKKLDEVIHDLNYVLQVKHEVNEKKELVKCSALCNDIKLSINSLLSREDVTIITDFSEVDEILTFKSYMYSIFFNLISNSIKYHQPGIAPVIEIRSYRHSNNSIELTFKDNGLGIDLVKKRNQVFGLYKRFHAHTEGKGMGLFMVKTQVETLGGTIEIASEVNTGTTFSIIFKND